MLRNHKRLKLLLTKHANLQHNDSAETGPRALTHEILQAQMVVNPSLFKERLETKRGERKLWGAIERLSKH